MDGDAPTSRAVTQNTFKGWIQIIKKNSWTNDGTNFKAPALICGTKPFASAGLSTHFAISLNSHAHGLHQFTILAERAGFLMSL